MKGQQIPLFDSTTGMVEGLHEHLQLEFESAYLYFGIATYFRQIDLDGFASWFDAQAQEEMEHGKRVYQYLLDRGIEVTLPDLKGGSTQYDSPLAAMETGLFHEQKISAKIRELHAHAREIGDVECELFLQWFVQEQIEEEALFNRHVQRLKMISDSVTNAPLLWLDEQMKSR